jgi:cytochrome c2
MISRIALAASLALAVAACGSNEQPSDQPSAAAEAPAAIASSAPASAAPEAAPSAAASEAAATPSPTPTPSASDSGAPKMSDAKAEAAPAGPPQAFNQCTACHSTAPGKTIIGPSLAHVYGRKAGTAAGFQYSDAMKNSGLSWNAGNLDAFLANPAGKVPGTLMGLAGIKDAAQRKAIVDYLKTL